MLKPSECKLPPKHCSTCPFEGTGGAMFHENPAMTTRYENLVSLKGQHYCHSTNNTICRGGRNLQIKVAYVMGAIPEATNECFEETLKRAYEAK